MFSKINSNETISKDQFLKMAAEVPTRVTKKRKQEVMHVVKDKGVVKDKYSAEVKSKEKNKKNTVSIFGTKKDFILSLAKKNASDSTKDNLERIKDAIVVGEDMPIPEEPDDINKDLEMFPTAEDYVILPERTDRADFFEENGIFSVPNSAVNIPTTLELDLVEDEPIKWDTNNNQGPPGIFRNVVLNETNLLIAGGFFSTPRESLNNSQQIYEMKQVQLDLVKSFQQIVQWNPVAAFFAANPGQTGIFPDIIKVFSEYDISIFLCNDNPDFTTLQKVYDQQYGDPDPGNPEWEYRVPRQMNQRKWFAFKDAEPDNPTFENGLKRIVKIYERMKRVTATLSGGSCLNQTLQNTLQPEPDTPFPNFGFRRIDSTTNPANPGGVLPVCQPVAVFGNNTYTGRYNFVNQPTEEREESVFPSEYIMDLTNNETEPGLFLYNGGMSIIWMFRKRSNLVDIPPSPRSNNAPNSADPFYNWLFYSYQIEPLAFRVVFRMETVIIPNDSFTKLFGIAVSTGFEINFPEMIIEGNSEEEEFTKQLPKNKLPIHPKKIILQQCLPC